MGQSRTNEVKITGGYFFDLNDVRWLVDQARLLDGDAKVKVSYYADQREGATSSLSITLED